MTGGIDVDGRVVRIDVAVARQSHDVNDDDPYCRTCGVEYPCALAEIVEQLGEWLDTLPASASAAGVESDELRT